jgi:hypothetical protein
MDDHLSQRGPNGSVRPSSFAQNKIPILFAADLPLARSICRDRRFEIKSKEGKMGRTGRVRRA